MPVWLPSWIRCFATADFGLPSFCFFSVYLTGVLGRSGKPGAAGVSPLEKAAAPQTKVAAAQLDHFCCAKIGTRTVLAESPTFVCSAKRGLIFSRGLTPAAPSDLVTFYFPYLLTIVSSN